MRVFKKYIPKQIAKYVVSFFKGQFVLEGSGVFEFDCGRVLATVKMDTKSLKICKEINECAGEYAYRLNVVHY